MRREYLRLKEFTNISFIIFTKFTSGKRSISFFENIFLFVGICGGTICEYFFVNIFSKYRDFAFLNKKYSVPLLFCKSIVQMVYP